MFFWFIIVFGINGTRLRVPILCVIPFPFANLRKKTQTIVVYFDQSKGGMKAIFAQNRQSKAEYVKNNY